MARALGKYVNPTHFQVAAKFSTATDTTTTWSIASGSTSPVSAGSSTVVSAGAIQIYIPDYAAEIRIVTGGACYLSESAYLHHRYFLMADTEYVFGCGELDSLYLAAVDSANTTIYFAFNLIA